MEEPDGVTSVNIRPGVAILSVLAHLNYKAWFAMAEFVDNSLQSFLDYRRQLEEVDGRGCKLKVLIDIDPVDEGRITIRDTAGGIHEADYRRAFRAASLPPDQTGLCEFGMGMKSAACWFAKKWTVRTSALGEPVERTVAFNISDIVHDALEELQVETRATPPRTHFTEITLTGLNRPIQGRTQGKIKDHLSSIYRKFIRRGDVEIRVNGVVLSYLDPPILSAPFYKEPSGQPVPWQKAISFDLGGGLRADGFAALRQTASTSEAGFALFRRDRLIQGSTEEGYRPEFVFGKSNSFAYQRLFGELQLEGFDISHTKDGFRWDDNEDAFLELLKEHLNEAPVPLLDQAEGYRARVKKEDIKQAAETATNRTAEAIEREVPAILEHQTTTEPDNRSLPHALVPAELTAKRFVDVQLNGTQWRIDLQCTVDPVVGDWVSVADNAGSQDGRTDSGRRRVGVRVALNHPFMERFGGSTVEEIEPLVRVAAAIGLGEVAARDSGAKLAGTVRRNVNELLRDGLSKP